MNLDALKKKAEAWGAVGAAVRPWLPYIVGAVVVAVLCVQWNGARRELAEARGAAAAADLRAKGLLVERDATIADLKGDAAAAALEVASFRAALSFAQRAEPALRIVEVVKWKTAPGQSAPGAVALPATPPGAAPVECLYARGNVGRVVGATAKLEGPAGARVVVMGTQFERLEPGPASVLWEGSASAPVSEAAALPGPAPLGHGFGGVAVAVPGYAGAGLSYSPPPFKWWILKSGEASIGVPVGLTGKSSGKPGVVVSVHARF